MIKTPKTINVQLATSSLVPVENVTIKNPSNINDTPKEHQTNNEKTKENEFKCKTCSAEFPDLQKCLAHELTTHICTIEQSGKKSQNSDRKRKSKSKTLSLSKETPFDIELRNKVKSILSECDDNFVLQKFCHLFQPSPENLNLAYQKIYDDLQFELNKRGSKWEIYPFGSTINAMALISSDMDFYINCTLMNGNNNIHSIGNKKRLFNKVKDILYQSNLFSNVIPVPRARVPVIKCTNNFTGINLDISLTSSIGVFNSKFIGKVINFDNRIHSILLIIKVWAKLWELTKTGRITNYCLTLLVFFYLQNCEPPILPSIQKFQENCQELIDDYNFGFEIPKNFNKLANKENIIELLRGFFKFYKNYKYDNFIICPYLGISIDKMKFKNNEFIFPEYEKQVINSKSEYNQSSNINKNFKNNDNNESKKIGLKLDSPVVIQDPFCLTINKFNTGPHIFAHFQKRLEIADAIFTDNNCSFGKLLIKLLYETVETVPIKKIISTSNTEIGYTKQTNTTQLSNASSNSYLFVHKPAYTNSFIVNPHEAELTFLRNYLRKKYPEKTFDTIEIKTKWCENLIKYFIEMLENVYKINIQFVTNENLTKSLKNHVQSDIHSNDNLIEIYKITSNTNLWSGRKNVNTKRGYAIYLEKTLETTNILENKRKLNSLFCAYLNCELIFRIAQDYSSVKIEMTNLNGKIGKQSFKTLFSEYSTNFRVTIIAYFERLTRED